MPQCRNQHSTDRLKLNCTKAFMKNRSHETLYKIAAKNAPMNLL